MKLFRIVLAGVLLFAMLLPLASCGSSLDSGLAVPTQEEENEQSTTQEEESASLAKYTAAQFADSVKFLGERTLLNDSGHLVVEWPGSGVEFTALIGEDGSDLMLGTRANYASSWVVYVDGQRWGDVVDISNGNKETMVAEAIPAGKHTIRVVKDSQPGTNRNNYNNIISLSFDGTFIKQGINDKEKYIEWIGDGYFVGFGALGNTAGSSKIIDETSFTASVPYLVSDKLNADYSVVAHSQLGFVYQAGGYNVEGLYMNHNAFRDVEKVYTPDRIPDVIVIHVGNDDPYASLTSANFVVAAENFIRFVRDFYGKDVPVVWIYNAVNHTHHSAEIQAMDWRSNSVYSFEAVYGQSGSGSKETVRYPSAEEHQKTAELLAPFLEKIIK